MDRGEGLDAFWFTGRLSSTLVYSDDDGESWQQSLSELKVYTPSIGLYGELIEDDRTRQISTVVPGR